MKSLTISLLALTALSACVAAPPQTAEEAAARQEYQTAWAESRKKAHGSILPGSVVAPTTSSEKEIEDLKELFPSPAVGDTY